MSTDADAIVKTVKKIFSDFEEHRPDSIESTLDDNCTVWDVFVPELIQGKENRVRYHAADQAQMQARGKLSYEITEPLVDVWGDIGLARYYLTFSYEPPNATSGRVRITSVFKRKNAGWQMIHHHEGIVPTGVPPITE